MQTPFIQNHQFNFIQKQADFLLKTLRSVVDRKVLETVRYTVGTNAVGSFNELTPDEKELLEQLSTYDTPHDVQLYMNQLEEYLIPFPEVSAKQIQKLFPKAKKLKLPDLESMDYAHTTYLRWIDIATSRLFIVYPHEGKFLGIEGRITATNKKGYCMFCHRHQELGFFNVKMKGHSADNFASIGQYVCMDNKACNDSITDITMLEKFLFSTVK
ncbi:FusB/FusC family EF-G-binding protein [Paenibacillus xylanilyticus]|uniref:FusB/FusC family EF-G-binding protein n=1 Tax=Paenibacillus xylanilyticus TaxID=248903 RepID=A0A7Y6C3E7_9BACL|nr:FusB/FusC family EF-G-binding protein [Paenibacillus xylanilyticus]NUU78829.1 FusB/FusC family EF-G-binding protein [Paenibacillus xylanilyticus]